MLGLGGVRVRVRVRVRVSQCLCVGVLLLLEQHPRLHLLLLLLRGLLCAANELRLPNAGLQVMIRPVNILKMIGREMKRAGGLGSMWTGLRLGQEPRCSCPLLIPGEQGP